MLFSEKIRSGLVLVLIFFVPWGTGCRQPGSRGLKVVWSEKQATGILVPTSMLGEEKFPVSSLAVFLEESKTPMLGEWQPEGDDFLFKPLIPLSPGKNYDVFLKKKLIGRLPVSLSTGLAQPQITAFYPSADTLPENLLKVYLSFSTPMREGEALRHIHLLNGKGDTLPRIFLELEPELWNPDRTILTVWLDPGRIKRGLIPNEQLGNPLKKGGRYTLVVSNDWKNTAGIPLQGSFQKKFFVGERDDTPPEPALWKLLSPTARTTEPLQISFTESLDPFLATETVKILDETGKAVQGAFAPTNHETGISFQPAKPWLPGHYKLQVATFLEDLAGNNLNRPFDRDITRQQKREDRFAERGFEIEGK